MRQLLVVSPGSCAGRAGNAVEQCQCRPYIVRSPEEAVRLDKQYRFAVGLVVVDSDDEDEVNRMLPVVNALRDIKWIAVLRPGVVESDSVRFIIAKRIYDFHHFPIDPLRLAIVLGHAYGMVRFQREFLLPPDPYPAAKFGMVGSSPAMLRLYDEIRKAADSDLPVLITGETGTGKEMVARAIYSASERAGGPFVALNCAAIPASLMHSELFGHEAGAFTHAFERRQGWLEASAGGTLFLDEIGEMPAESQPLLLRFLQEKTVVRLGSSSAGEVDVRIIAATNRDLEHGIRAGTFREDLFYRLAVLRIGTPALRDRKDDIDALAEHFIGEASRTIGVSRPGLTPDALAAVRRYPWPGNLRELRSRILQTVLDTEDGPITASDLNLVGLWGRPAVCIPSLKKAREMAERDTLEIALRSHEGNVARAAKQLQISRMTLYRLLEKHKIEISR